MSRNPHYCNCRWMMKSSSVLLTFISKLLCRCLLVTMFLRRPLQATQWQQHPCRKLQAAAHWHRACVIPARTRTERDVHILVQARESCGVPSLRVAK